MSHFTTVKTKIIHREFLISSLNHLADVKYFKAKVLEDAIARSWDGDRRHGDVVFQLSRYDIAFNKVDGHYTASTDEWAIRNTERISMKSFMEEVHQRYCRDLVLSQVEAKGFGISEERIDSAGTVRLVVRKW